MSRSEADDENETVVSNASQRLYASASPDRTGQQQQQQQQQSSPAATAAAGRKGPPPVPRSVPETDESEEAGPEAKAKRLFGMCDLNKDGTVTKSEMVSRAHLLLHTPYSASRLIIIRRTWAFPTTSPIL